MTASRKTCKDACNRKRRATGGILILYRIRQKVVNVFDTKAYILRVHTPHSRKELPRAVTVPSGNYILKKPGDGHLTGDFIKKGLTQNKPEGKRETGVLRTEKST